MARRKQFLGFRPSPPLNPLASLDGNAKTMPKGQGMSGYGRKGRKERLKQKQKGKECAGITKALYKSCQNIHFLTLDFYPINNNGIFSRTIISLSQM
jgi:hypothetical protein